MKAPVILLDIPWPYATYSDAGKGRSAETHYNTMSISDLNTLDLNPIAADDCALFMWATWPTMHQAMALIDAWGFQYKTCAFNWVKMNKMQVDIPFVGMGYYTRSNSEPCLLATRGNPQRISKSVQQVALEWTGGMFETETYATPIQEHSRKPDIIHKRIMQLMCGPYIELFARRLMPGWSCAGNELDHCDIQESIHRLALL